MITYQCPHCQARLSIPDQYAGKRGKCNHCGQLITAPGGNETQPDTSIPESRGPRRKRVALGVLGTLVLLIVVAGLGSEEQAPVDNNQPPSPTGPPTTESEPGDYTIDVDPVVTTDGKRVKMDISTDIPGVITVMASVSLANQKGSDIHIGTSKRVQLMNGKGTVRLSVADLPTGDYDAEVSFYPRWGFGGLSRTSVSIEEPIHSSKRIRIQGSGQTVLDRKTMDDGQNWVMTNIGSFTDSWDELEWKRRFGDFEEVPVSGGTLNPKAIKAYYFPEIDMTIFVAILRTPPEISHWRIGRASS